MPYSYDYYERQRRQSYGPSSRRTAWGYWVPLAVTVTVATVGLVAWVWSERKDDEEDEKPSRPPPTGHGNIPPPSGYGPPPGFDGPPPEESLHTPGSPSREVEEKSIVARMSGALRRTPSPQQIFDSASRRVVAGVNAAGAAVGGALSSIREEDKGGYEDHSRWSEEADSQNGTAPPRKGPELRDLESTSTVRPVAQPRPKTGSKRKTVAIVISAETDYEHSEDAGYHQEHAVRLSSTAYSIRVADLLRSQSSHIFPNMSTQRREYLYSFTLRTSSDTLWRIRNQNKPRPQLPLHTPILVMKTHKFGVKSRQILTRHLPDPRCSTLFTPKQRRLLRKTR